MRVVAVTNQKGGTAKTTTAVNVAAALGESGTRVLVLDLDPQASASSWLGVHGATGLLEVFQDGKPMGDAVVPTVAPGVDLVPSSAWLLGVERKLAGEPGAEAILRKAIEKLPQRWDVLLVDCPPSLGLLSVSALAAAGEVLVPVEASTLALAGLAALLQTLDKVRERLNPELAMGALLICRVDQRTNLTRSIAEDLRERFGAAVLGTMIRETVRLREAPSFGKPITLYAPASSGAEDYRAAARELSERWSK